MFAEQVAFASAHDASLGLYVSAWAKLGPTDGLGMPPAILTSPSALVTAASATSRSNPCTRKIRTASSSPRCAGNVGPAVPAAKAAAAQATAKVHEDQSAMRRA